MPWRKCDRVSKTRATTDLKLGAALETADVNQFYPVAKSLERVQGSARMSIERYRAVARAEAYERQQRRESIRYEQRRRAEAEVLRNPKFAPIGPGRGHRSAATRRRPAPAAPMTRSPKTRPRKQPTPKPPAAEPPEDMPADEADKPEDENPFADEKDAK